MASPLYNCNRQRCPLGAATAGLGLGELATPEKDAECRIPRVIRLIMIILQEESLRLRLRVLNYSSLSSSMRTGSLIGRDHNGG